MASQHSGLHPHDPGPDTARVIPPPRAAAIACIVAAALVAAVCGGGAKPPPAPRAGAPLTPQSVYANMLAAMTQPGQLYHPTIEGVALQAPFTLRKTQDAWIDVPRGLARVEVTSDFGGGDASNVHRATWIIDGRRWYQTQEDAPTRMREAQTCHDSDSPVLSLLLACRGFTERSVTVVQPSVDYAGAPAVAIITYGNVPGADTRQSYTDTLYIDAATYLPLAIESNGVLSDASAAGAPIQTGEITRFTNGFVPASSLDASAFAPASIGWTDRDVAAPLDKTNVDFTYLWLGKSLAPSGGLPPITLNNVFAADGAVRPLLRYRAVLDYRPAGDDFAAPVVELQEWRLDEWQSQDPPPSDWWDGPCVTREEVGVPSGGRAVIYSGYTGAAPDAACPPGDPDRFAAEVTAGATFAIVSAKDGGGYASASGLRAIVDAIQAR